MNLEFKASFVRDLKKIKDKNLKGRVQEVIEAFEQAHSLQEIENVKKLKGMTDTIASGLAITELVWR